MTAFPAEDLLAHTLPNYAVERIILSVLLFLSALFCLHVFPISNYHPIDNKVKSNDNDTKKANGHRSKRSSKKSKALDETKNEAVQYRKAQ